MAVQQVRNQIHFVGSSTDTKPTKIGSEDIGAGSTFWVSDTDANYTYDGNSWNLSGTGITQSADATTGLPVNNKSISGATLVTQKTTAGLSTYDADKLTSTTSAREAIPSGAQAVWVCNESVVTTESVRFMFGDATVVALTTAGYRVSPGITTAAGDNGPKEKRVEVPTDATHWAYIAEAGTPTINVVWEF